MKLKTLPLKTKRTLSGLSSASSSVVPQRWPLARLSISLQKCVDHLDRVLAGCCWEVHATRADPEEWLSFLCQVSKCLTMLLAVYLAKEVAAILQEILTHPTKKLCDDRTAHLLCSNCWVQPIHQELLHSSSRYNATRTGERNSMPSNGLAGISAHTGPPKKLKPFSVSEISEKTDLRTFQDIAKNQFKQQCKRNNYAEIKLDHRPRTRRIQSASGVARFRDTTDGECSISTHLTQW